MPFPLAQPLSNGTIHEENDREFFVNGDRWYKRPGLTFIQAGNVNAYSKDTAIHLQKQPSTASVIRLTSNIHIGDKDCLVYFHFTGKGNTWFDWSTAKSGTNDQSMSGCMQRVPDQWERNNWFDHANSVSSHGMQITWPVGDWKAKAGTTFQVKVTLHAISATQSLMAWEALFVVNGDFVTTMGDGLLNVAIKDVSTLSVYCGEPYHSCMNTVEMH